MSAFFCKKIPAPPQRICIRLKELRQQAGASLGEMATKTKIDKKYLQALENCQFQDLPKALVYQKNIVRRYVESLGVKPEPFLAQYLVEETKKDKTKKHPHTAIKNNFWCSLPSYLRWGTIALIILLLIFYLGWQVKNIIEPPKLAVFSPTEGLITENSNLLVVGETEPEAMLTINGQTAKNNENGQFTESIYLSPGVNTITIIAQKRHGKSTTLTCHVVYREVDKTP